MALKTEQLVSEIGKLTVLELAELVKALEEQFGVSAAMPMAVAAPAASAEAAPAKAEEKSEYKVELVEGGPDKIKTIKALRSVKNIGLTEAKKAVEEVPTVLEESVSKENAMKMKEALEAAGAKVKLS
ncbi:50S ribosomal protein L7/L12 [Candidatus Babela massiliensis]|uniref:Large ribosomal subunit protein bL12 n=1 Tax=Candidatus Babela massiliensis TaxID=673862 RepID=V6DJ52_9BACT|nr:50S ribosomal protein L7/L12 [Candidatus Babela massiliensis]CDK30541.1 ribosomal protein L7/L12 [Candidatus Babela massiliensis]